MKTLFASAAMLVLASGHVFAADPSPIGDWLVKDGYANIRIDICGGKLWGIVAWEKVPGTDTENPDPAKKSRPTLGMPVLMGLAPAKQNRWEGEIYNSQNGKTYGANVSMVDDNTLDLEGCLVWPLCLAQKWTRVTTPPPGALPLPPVKGAAPPPAQSKKGPPPPVKGAPPAAAVSDVCARVAADQSTANTKGASK